MWINSVHRCASVHNAMCTLTGLQHKNSEQHIELGVSGVKRDNDDPKKIQNWLQIHNPFYKNETALKSLSTGLIGNGMDVNCDEAEKVGQSIQEKLDVVCVEDATVKRKDRVTTLAMLRPGIKIDTTILIQLFYSPDSRLLLKLKRKYANNSTTSLLQNQRHCIKIISCVSQVKLYYATIF